MRPPAETIRVGVLADGTSLPAWLHEAVSDAAAVDGIRLSHVFLDTASVARPGLLRLPFALYERLDRRVYATAPDPLAPQDAEALFAGAEVVRLPRAGRGPDAAALLDALTKADLDVLLHLGSRTLAAAALCAPRLGVWTWSSLEQERRGGAPFLRAVETAGPICEVQLLVLRPDGERPRILERSWSDSDPSGREACEPVSLYRARAPAYWKSAAFPARALRRIVAGREPAAGSLPEAEPLPVQGPVGPFRLARLTLLVLARLARRRWRSRRFEARWALAVRRRRPGLPYASTDGFELLPVPEGRFAADPFLVREGDRDLLFYEDADLRSGLGRIACAELDGKGRPIRAAAVLEGPHHLSYPCVFAWDGHWWMIPESSRRLALYRATSFPWQWTLERLLFDGVRAVDATVHAHDGRLWLFVNMARDGVSPHDELFLFHASDPRGPWAPHPQNPVVSDVRCARPGGRLFEHEGRLYRPAQDCSERYGGALVLQRVERLDEHEYRETTASRTGPDWCPGAIATHALALSEDLEVVDVRILEPRR